MKNNFEQTPFKQKTQQMQRNIRGNQLQQKFAFERRQMGKIGDRKTIQQKNYQKLRQFVERGDPKEIYEALTPITNDMISAMDRLAMEIFKLCYKNLEKQDALRLLSIIIMYCYDDLRQHLANINFFDQTLNELYKAIGDDNPERITLLLMCIKNMASRKYDIIDYEKFAERHLFILFEKLRTYPHFMVFAAFTSQATTLPLEKILPQVFLNVLNKQQNQVVRIASVVIAINLTAKSNYQALKPYVKKLFDCFRITFYGKDQFNLTNKFRSLEMMKKLLDIIPQQDYNNINMEEQFKKIICTINHCKDLQRLDLVQAAFKIFWEIVKKIIRIGEHYFDIFLMEQTLQLLAGGLPKDNLGINEISMNTISLVLNEAPQQSPFIHRLSSTNIIPNLQKFTLQKNRDLRSRAEHLLNLINQHSSLDEQL